MIINKVNYFSIIKNIAIVLHIIPVIFFVSLPICIIFEEYFAILPILLMSTFVLVIAQILFHLFKKEKQLKIIEAMIIASISWFVFSMVKKPSKLSHILQWFRSFQQWIVGWG